ncbi:MAG: hypothetical protein AB7F50_11300 [Fimbriimonadaceae bacterium]
MPQYFSGTLNQAMGTAVCPGLLEGEANWMVQAWLLIDGLHVKEWTKLPGEPDSTSVDLNATFDSSYFPDQSVVVVGFRAKDRLGNFYPPGGFAIGTAIVKNKALLGNHSFAAGPAQITHPNTQTHNTVQQGLASATSAFGTGRYTVVKKLWAGLELDGWKQELGGANFVWVTTHGTSDYYEMQSGDGFTDEPESDNDSHKAVLMTTVGSVFSPGTYPPYNPSGVPPCNFIFVDSCRTLDADFSWTLYPKYNLFAGPGGFQPKNQFVAGWKVTISSLWSKTFATRTMTYLASGRHAQFAVAQAAADMGVTGFYKVDGIDLDFDLHGAHHGDQFAKVAGVYTGNALPETGWVR